MASERRRRFARRRRPRGRDTLGGRPVAGGSRLALAAMVAVATAPTPAGLAPDAQYVLATLAFAALGLPGFLD